MRSTLKAAIVALAGFAGLAMGAAEAGTISGAGATFPIRSMRSGPVPIKA